MPKERSEEILFEHALLAAQRRFIARSGSAIVLGGVLGRHILKSPSFINFFLWQCSERNREVYIFHMVELIPAYQVNLISAF